MKLIDKMEMSKWAYIQCKNGNDTEEMRNLITEDYHLYMYCFNICYSKKIINKIQKKILGKIFYHKNGKVSLEYISGIYLWILSYSISMYFPL